MNLVDFFLDQLEREAVGTRKAMERVPEGRNDWKPHEKSMPLGYLAALVANMPSWVAFMVNEDELDMTSPKGMEFKPQVAATSAELRQTLENSLATAREVLTNTTEEHLLKPWRFLAGGHVVSEEPPLHYDPRCGI